MIKIQKCAINFLSMFKGVHALIDQVPKVISQFLLHQSQS